MIYFLLSLEREDQKVYMVGIKRLFSCYKIKSIKSVNPLIAYCPYFGVYLCNWIESLPRNRVNLLSIKPDLNLINIKHAISSQLKTCFKSL